MLWITSSFKNGIVPQLTVECHYLKKQEQEKNQLRLTVTKYLWLSSYSCVYSSCFHYWYEPAPNTNKTTEIHSVCQSSPYHKFEIFSLSTTPNNTTTTNIFIAMIPTTFDSIPTTFHCFMSRRKSPSFTRQESTCSTASGIPPRFDCLPSTSFSRGSSMASGYFSSARSINDNSQPLPSDYQAKPEDIVCGRGKSHRQPPAKPSYACVGRSSIANVPTSQN